ncbi:ComF family protein [Stakelama tenebrarum]|uniref:ComF family protein n=1 Tax=Stakelama tenebrarum TaxID=2711215 RepID=A0A6G6YAK7_9SPHN|nr:ComF family protein [Sphingosinithalassobacter tenebrarum]QIG81972.1 ComF family protein [Sphingosinithalassobacter tenebrarum]
MLSLAPPVRAVARIADLALPPRCPGCSAVTQEDHRFCAACWAQLRFLGEPWCATCNLPFEYDLGPGAQCGECMVRPPAHDGVRAAVAYGDIARSVALKLKYGGRMAAADTMARAMARLMPGDADLLIPVPLHRWRLWRRGYNQALLLAQALGRASAVPIARDILLRTKATPVLRGMNPKERRKAVAGAFALADGTKNAIAGKRIVLVDDVFTSGATATACAVLLKRGGATKVTLLCWARVLPGETAD